MSWGCMFVVHNAGRSLLICQQFVNIMACFQRNLFNYVIVPRLEHKWAALGWTIWLDNKNQCQNWRLQFIELRMDPKSNTKAFLLLWLQLLLRANNAFRMMDFGSSIQPLFEGECDWNTEQKQKSFNNREHICSVTFTQLHSAVDLSTAYLL